MSHNSQLEEIDNLQRQQEADNQLRDNTEAFAKPIVEALDTTHGRTTTPLLEQEEIEDEEPPRINLTAVICTAIVAFCATVILLVAHPWSNDRNRSDAQPVLVVENTAEKAPTPSEQKAATDEAKPNQEKPVPQKATNTEAEQKKVPDSENIKPAASTLPVVKTTKTGTGNIYNNIRLIDASSRPLSKSEVEQMTKEELALARNAIYARHGYKFNNPDLKEFFAKQSWFKPSDVKIDAIPFTDIELDNIRLIKAQETK